MSKKQDREAADFPFGKIVGVHGLRGEVKVRPGSNNPEILANVKHLQCRASKYCPELDFEIESSHFDKRMFYICFAGYEDRNAVEPLVGAELFTWKDEIGQLDDEEYWVKDLVGMTVLKENGEEVGKIIDIIYSGNDILEVRRDSDPPGKTILIPFVKAIVPTVDLAGRKVILAEIPGLLDAQ